MSTRLKKNDAKQLAATLRARRWSVVYTADRVEARDPDTGEFICGFYWSKLHRAWRLDSPRPFIHTQDDLSLALNMLDNDRQAIKDLETIFEEWAQAKAQGRWQKYRGALAAFYLRDMT